MRAKAGTPEDADEKDEKGDGSEDGKEKHGEHWRDLAGSAGCRGGERRSIHLQGFWIEVEEGGYCGTATLCFSRLVCSVNVLHV